MPEHTYPWKRFWNRRGDLPDLSDMGYLRDPDAAHWLDEAPRAVAFEEISVYPCLVLLGEPGIGKTTVLERCHEQVAAQVAATGDRTLPVKLGRYGSEASLYQAIFDKSIVHEWERGAHHLHLFLDGLDETLMNMRVVVGLLAEQLSRYSAERLYLRITCRGTDWPHTLEQALRHHWGEQQVGVFEMAPLRRIDVVAAAQANNLDPGTFLHAIDRVGAVPFANRPITLRFLLNSFKRDRRLPPTKQALYDAGCEQLCEEQNPDRRDAGLTGNFTGPQRLAAAERIAAVTVFTQHKTVWTDIDRADVLPEDIPVRDLGRDGHTDPRFTEPAIREALSTALFTSRGERRLGWAHQTYAEFLAARYLRDLALPQILSLIVHTADPTGGVVPQLRDIAAWLAGMRQDVYDALLQRDPRVLLRSDLLRVGSDQRAALVAALLHAVAQDDYMDDGGGTTGLQHLAHPGLADQLRPSSVVIETKGCWHRELDDAMQTQLAERYLHESGCTYGLYLVGWFICEQWDASDSRKWQSPQVTLAEARDKFDNQARMLSQQGVVIKAYVLNVALR